MEKSSDYLLKNTHQYPNLLTITNVPKQKLKLELKLNSKISTASINGHKNLIGQYSTPKSKLSTTLKILSSKKRLTTKPILIPSDMPTPIIKNNEKIYFPTTPDEVCKTLTKLPDWLKQELRLYKTIYFISKFDKPENIDFDDEKGDYKLIKGDDIAYRFEIIENLGKGSFGQVVKAFDHLQNRLVALKIIKNRQRYIEQANIEIEILKYLNEKDKSNNHHIVCFQENFVFRGHVVSIK